MSEIALILLVNFFIHYLPPSLSILYRIFSTLSPPKLETVSFCQNLKCFPYKIVSKMYTDDTHKVVCNILLKYSLTSDHIAIIYRNRQPY